MTAIASLGIGSNLDLTTLLANLKTGEQAPLVAMQKQQASYSAKLSAYGQLNAALSALQTASAALAKPELFEGVKASASDGSVLSATAAASAPSGVYAVNVTQLSQAQSLAAAGVLSGSADIASGAKTTLTFEFGTLSGDPADLVTGKFFNADFGPASPPRTTSITLDPGAKSLEEIRDAINAKTSLGVTAAIVNDGGDKPYRLVLTSTQAGAASSMRITVSGDPAVPGSQGDATLTGLLTNDPDDVSKQMRQTVAAQDTKLTVNGLAITSASNSVAGAVPDVTMTVSKAGASTLTVQNDTGSVQGAVSTFVSAYNSLQSLSTRLSAYDAANRSGAILLGDSVLRNVQVGIRATLTGAQAQHSSGLTMLSQIGITFQKDGTLAVESTKLTTALSGKLSGIANLFSGNDGVGGYGTQMAALITSYTDTGGTLSAATKGINTTLDTLSKRYTATTARIDATVARYKTQFTQLDQMISSMNQTSSYLTQQFDALNNTSKN